MLDIAQRNASVQSEDFGFMYPAGLDPFVVLPGQDRADKADDRVAAGEDAHDVGPPAYLFIQAFLYPVPRSSGAIARLAAQSCT